VSGTVLPIPPGITVEMAEGFSLYMPEAIIGGRGGDLVDLARTDLWEQWPCRLGPKSY
jgi:pyruvate dehydrogenase (quinone)